MAVTLQHERDNIYRIDISGTLAERDFTALQRFMVAEIEARKKVRLMVVLEHFKGWAPGNWRDRGFYFLHSAAIERIAIVGDERWRQETLMFAAADLRSGAVAFFSPPYRQEARNWLSNADA